ncbi:multiple antibiotic resistance protein MarB [Trabulsiella odontotermitis]|uniref:multiple antibiotic resistance protein MarB n=1 Tax=Trabulsiella odontotermitis TaxID=379893 RepID=UPI0024B8426F|nr:multiple antibiotic resistance protein MarB [Trabulsiella odontotermitis]WHP29419.1 multiple antibiotic resistance protein MarB [Trabulsiella odontotermitis]
MKLFASAALALLALASGQSFAEQSTTHASQPSRETMIMPTAQNQSPFDFNHMAAGSDKSDELGVPYYNKRNQ